MSLSISKREESHWIRSGERKRKKRQKKEMEGIIGIVVVNEKRYVGKRIVSSREKEDGDDKHKTTEQKTK